MREIKFREWDNERMRFIYSTLGVWYFDVTHHADGKIHGDEGDTELEEIKDSLSGWMQFTGLKDKNGKEIYEGDILRGSGDWNKPAVVEWEGGGFHGTGGYKHMGWTFFANMEIIGNIYSNPELLK